MADIASKWIRHLRTGHPQDRTERQTFTCDICGDETKSIEAWREHAQCGLEHRNKWAKPPHLYVEKGDVDTRADVNAHAHQAKRPSPGPFVIDNPQINRSRARNEARHDLECWPHKNTSGRQLWSQDDVQPKSHSQGRSIPLKEGPLTEKNRSRPPRPLHNDDDEYISKMMRQPETRPIPQDQLVAEVKGIYAGLVMVETKCLEVDNAPSSNTDVDINSKLKNEQWQKLIALHTTLPYEHNEFFFGWPPPPARPASRRLASKYATPATPMRQGSHFSSGLKDYRVEARVGLHRVDALADTGAQSNFISAQFVDKIGLVPDDRTPRTIQLPGGKQLISPGTVKVPFSFHGEVEKYTLDCWIILGCTSDLVLSGPFLRATKTLTTFKNRIKESMRNICETRLRINLLGNERQRLWGSLNGRSALALPDTGSDVMLVSAKWARENNLEIDYDPIHRLELERADGSRVFTSGVVHNATWTFGDSAQDVHCDFYVLEDLSVDMVFSNDFIFELDVFSNFDRFMIDLDSKPDLSEFYNVRLISKYSQELARLEEESINDMYSPHSRKAERVRRDRIRDAINTLEPAKQNEAWKEEWQRRLIWDRHHDQQKRKAELVGTDQTLAQVNGQPLPRAKPPWWKMFLRK